MFNIYYCSQYKDIYNIYNLITKIDKNYKLYFNNKSKEYIVVDTAKNNKIIKNIEDENEKIIELNNKKIKNDTIEKMIETINFSKRVSDISSNDIKKIIGENVC